ncbi:smr-1 [Pristionchus pacificus]|uniref:Smr-1 n=1 Tax=Pristionchus pacificus TaxID=54126 RepID=A0A454Y6V6_PRIPA|nr:smr-1 [Pristionchus pacificus]|eukprot:PDM62717.1 smr-1 [Pristionchus pacificus]
MSDELANYKLQLQQVEAALLGEPNNDELIKLKSDLEEVIALQEELVEEAGGSDPTSSQDRSHERLWKVGDRVLAPSTNGQHYPAVIDGISGETIAVTFVGNGLKTMTRRAELKDAPMEAKKTYIFDKETGQKQYNKKNEWQAEKERRKLRAQKKEMKKKELDGAKEGEKNKWHSFNSKALNKGMKGMKRVAATGSASDTVGKRDNLVSSRKDQWAFAKSQRGNMDSLF